MKNSKLIQLLKTFSEEELTDFEKFLNSPLSNSRNYIVKYFQELKKHYPEFREDKIDSKVIFSKIYKDKKYNDSTVRSIVSNLIKDAEHYLGYKNFKLNDTFQDYYLLSELRIRKLNDYYDLKAKAVLKNLKKNKQFDFNKTIYEYLFSLEISDQYIETYKYENSVEFVNILNDSIVTFFSANSILSSSQNKVLKTFFPFEPKNILDTNFFPNLDYKGFISSIENDNTNRAKFLKLNYNLYNLIKDKNPHESYTKIKELWLDSSDFLTASSKYSVFICLGDFCLIQNRNEGSIYVKEFFELSKVMLREKLFLTQSKILHLNNFRQIILHCYKLNEIDWAENFIKTYSKYLAEDEREMLVELSMSGISILRKDFQRALSHLSNIKKIIPGLKLELRMNYIVVYYELNYTDQLYSAFDSYRHYLKIAPFLPNYIKNAKNFLKYITAISSYRIKNNIDLDILRKELTGDPNVHLKWWLLDKIEELQ